MSNLIKYWSAEIDNQRMNIPPSLVFQSIVDQTAPFRDILCLSLCSIKPIGIVLPNLILVLIERAKYRDNLSLLFPRDWLGIFLEEKQSLSIFRYSRKKLADEIILTLTWLERKLLKLSRPELIYEYCLLLYLITLNRVSLLMSMNKKLL